MAHIWELAVGGNFCDNWADGCWIITGRAVDEDAQSGGFRALPRADQYYCDISQHEYWLTFAVTLFRESSRRLSFSIMNLRSGLEESGHIIAKS